MGRPATVHGRGTDDPSPEGSGRPPHRSQRALLTHWAPALGPDGEALLRPRVGNPNRRKPPVDEAPHPGPVEASTLAPPPQGTVPALPRLAPKGVQRGPVGRHPVVRDMAADHR